MVVPEQHPNIVVLGGMNMDLVTITPRFPGAGETVVGSRFLTCPGGKGANQAVAAARMDGHVAMVGLVGGDIFGRQLIDSLAAGGVDAGGVSLVAGISSGIAVIIIHALAENRIVQILGTNDACGDAEAARVSKLMIRASTLMLQLEVPVELSLRVAKAAYGQGKTVILGSGPVRPLPAAFYPCCTVITPNETEAQALVGFPADGRGSAARAALELLRWGAGSVVIKLGSQGAYFAAAEGVGLVAPFPVEAVDSVAAGNAFNGALAVSLGEGRELGQAVLMAPAAGALAVARPWRPGFDAHPCRRGSPGADPRSLTIAVARHEATSGLGRRPGHPASRTFPLAGTGGTRPESPSGPGFPLYPAAGGKILPLRYQYSPTYPQ